MSQENNPVSHDLIKDSITRISIEEISKRITQLRLQESNLIAEVARWANDNGRGNRSPNS